MKTEPTSLRPHMSVEIRPSIYDQVSAIVVALILIFGFLLLVLLSIWFKPAVDHTRHKDVDFPDPDPKQNKLELKEFIEPGVEEFPEVSVPQLAQMLAATSMAVSTVQGGPETRIGSNSQSGPGKHIRIPGLVGIRPVQKRWSIQFQADNLDSYAKQLSNLNIDVAAIHRSRNSIWRVHDVAGVNKVIETNRQQENTTLRFQNKKTRMRDWDRELCERAGVEVSDTIQSHFYPASAKLKLEELESVAVAQANRQLKNVRKTTFKVVERGGGFSFEVAEILYH